MHSRPDFGRRFGYPNLPSERMRACPALPCAPAPPTAARCRHIGVGPMALKRRPPECRQLGRAARLPSSRRRPTPGSPSFPALPRPPVRGRPPLARCRAPALRPALICPFSPPPFAPGLSAAAASPGVAVLGSLAGLGAVGRLIGLHSLRGLRLARGFRAPRASLFCDEPPPSPAALRG